MPPAVVATATMYLAFNDPKTAANYAAIATRFYAQAAKLTADTTTTVASP